ncbi:MAG: substrate-binding domain-containing protein [Lachnospiraceae bacterium]|nr:substrate-binding domain-containing protein [Lachnospiraceae bacterium]
MKIQWNTVPISEGFCSEYKKHGIDIDESRIIFTPRVREALDESKQAIRYLVNTSYEFDGIFAISDWRALGSYLVLNELGIKVPDEVRIIGYDGISAASRTVLNITSIQQDIALIAQNAIDLIQKQINGDNISSKSIIIPTNFISGQTT